MGRRQPPCASHKHTQRDADAAASSHDYTNVNGDTCAHSDRRPNAHTDDDAASGAIVHTSPHGDHGAMTYDDSTLE